MKISSIAKLKSKDLIVFDLDGTLIRTKFPMDTEMSELITCLLKAKKVAIIGGAKYSVLNKLFLHKLKCSKNFLEKLFLFPTTATTFYKYNNGWKQIYELRLKTSEVARIKEAFEEVFQEMGYKHPKKTYGEIVEDRGSQVTFAVYGQDIVKVLGMKGVEMKEHWLKKNLKIKMKMANLLAKKLPNLEVRSAGFTAIDVTKKGIDKAFGILQMQKYLKIPISQMLFVGDAMFKGGNDYAVVKTGVDWMSVKDPEETKKIISQILNKHD
jgi:HAD superfamily hydrolase (TIGR01484 family)